MTNNSKNNDLWAALSDASGKGVTKIMEVWTKEVGYPVISVTESGDGIHVQQNRFLQTGDATPEEDRTIYPVLLTLSTGKGAHENILFNVRSMSIPLQDLNFIKLNVNHSEIYRTLYTPERLLKLGEAMKLDLLEVEDRIRLISDTAALPTSGYQKTSAFLGLLANLKEESNSIVWGEIIDRLAAIQHSWLFQPQETQSALKHFIRDLVSPKARALGWEFNANDEILLQQHRSAMFRAAGLAGDEV
jgi:aminopeptidase 2